MPASLRNIPRGACTVTCPPTRGHSSVHIVLRRTRGRATSAPPPHLSWFSGICGAKDSYNRYAAISLIYASQNICWCCPPPTPHPPPSPPHRAPTLSPGTPSCTVEEGGIRTTGSSISLGVTPPPPPSLSHYFSTDLAIADSKFYHLTVLRELLFYIVKFWDR